MFDILKQNKVKTLFIFLLFTITYYYILNSTDYYLLLIIIIPSWLYILYSVSAYHRPDKKTFGLTDQLITFSIYIVFIFIMYIFNFIMKDILGLSVSNPISIVMYCILFVIFLFFLIPRYKSITRIKIIGFIISSIVFLLGGFTFAIFNSLEYNNTGSIGTQDPFYITIGMYILWTVLFSFLLYSHGADMTTKKTLLMSSPLIFFILYYTWKRCDPQENTGNPDIKKEATWIYATTNLAITAAYIFLFLGQFLNSTIIGIIAFAMLDQCALKNDKRVIAVSSLLCILLPFFYMLVKIYNLTSK